MADEVDRARVEALTARLLAELRPELARAPFSRDNVFVALNALAYATAGVLAVIDRNGRRFFDQALADNIAELRRHPPRGPSHAGHA
jgi:hypothetical protein